MKSYTVLVIAVVILSMLMVGCGGGGMGVVSASESNKLSSGPTISSITPDTATVSTDVTVQVIGKGFDSSSVLMVNNSPTATTVIDSSNLKATVTATTLAQSGDANVTVSNTSSKLSSNALKIRVVKSLTILTTSLQAANQGASYQAALAASGGVTPYSWTGKGGLPPGMSVAKDGTLTGTPTASGNYQLSIAVSDSSSPAKNANSTLTLQVLPLPLSVTTKLPAATAGTPYSGAIAATGGTTPYKWFITSGSLPSGLTLSASTGAVSGTPTASGTYNFGVSVSDSSSTVQTQSAASSIVVAASPLAITNSNLSSGTVGTSYAGSLKANGGTLPYTWSIASGSLPAGLTLAPSTGAISGTPTTTGTFNFTVAVADSSSTVQKQSAITSITIVAAPSVPTLAISAVSLPSATVSSTYSTTVQATGGTPAYTWSIASGQLPPGLTLAATTGQISGTPNTAGSYTFTLKVADNGNPVQTATASASIAVAAQTSNTSSGKTWYVRTDGGTAVQCNGLVNAGYPGTGTGQACAFKHPFFLLTSNTTWRISGGDTVIIADGSYEMGYDPAAGNNTGSGGVFDTSYGGTMSYAATLPPFPSGPDESHPTRFLGAGYATGCSTRPELWGTQRAYSILSIKNTGHIDIECLEITDHAQCLRNSANASYTYACPSPATYPNGPGISDNGIVGNDASDVTIRNVLIHGMSDNGVAAGRVTDLTFERSTIRGNGHAGWNFDPGDGGSGNNPGYHNFTDWEISWNGCIERYPYIEGQPIDCHEDYSDAIGTGADSGDWYFTRGKTVYNMHDGIDLLHHDGGGGTIVIDRLLSYANRGNQVKATGNATIMNSVLIGNCRAANLLPIPWNNHNCRTFEVIDTAMSYSDTVKIYNNTIIQGDSTYLVFYDQHYVAITSPHMIVKNNLMQGNGTADWFGYSTANPQPTTSYVSGDHNLAYNTYGPHCQVAPFNDTICNSDPLLIHYAANGTLDAHLQDASPAKWTGTRLVEVTTDFDGLARPLAPSIGAFDK